MLECDILEELRAKYALKDKQPGEFTIYDFMEATGLQYKKASRILHTELRAGVLQHRYGIVSGKRMGLYSKV